MEQGERELRGSRGRQETKVRSSKVSLVNDGELREGSEVFGEGQGVLGEGWKL